MSLDAMRTRAQYLQAQKEDVEVLIDAYQKTLISHGATMHSPSLVDAEGFPRADLDVPAIRTARTALIRAKNDRDALVDELARCLEVVHRRRDEEGVRAVPASTSASRAVGEAQEEAERLPFARVNTVASGSPAEQAGLLPQDLILQFANLSKSSLSALSDIATVVNRSEGTEIQLVVRRQEGALTAAEGSQGDAVEKTLMLVPRTGWGGRGMLGCHILPV